jgi:hypothetical protein
MIILTIENRGAIVGKKVRLTIPKDQKLKLEDLNISDAPVENTDDSLNIDIYQQNEHLDVKKYKRISSLKNIVIVLFTIIITILIVLSIVRNINYKNSNNNEEQPKEKITTNLKGRWQSSYNGLFVFQEDNTFYWYNSYENLENNYYKGVYTYKNGTEALLEMGYSQEEFYQEYGMDIKLDNIYSINLKPNYVFMSGKDITKIELKQNENWWYLLIVDDDGTAFGYNKTLDIKYSLIKKTE